MSEMDLAIENSCLRHEISHYQILIDLIQNSPQTLTPMERFREIEWIADWAGYDAGKRAIRSPRTLQTLGLVARGLAAFDHRLTYLTQCMFCAERNHSGDPRIKEFYARLAALFFIEPWDTFEQWNSPENRKARSNLEWRRVPRETRTPGSRIGSMVWELVPQQ